MKKLADLGNNLPKISKYANVGMTVVAKMKLIYPPSQIWGEQSCVFHIPGSNR